MLARPHAAAFRAAFLAAVFCPGTLPCAAQAPAEAAVRVSVKRVLSPSGSLPSGQYAPESEITRVIGKCNTVLDRMGSGLTVVLEEVVNTQAASGFYSMSAGEISSLESAAKANPTGYAWRTDAINIYVVDDITDAGGVCSFPTVGPNREAIVINSRGILGGSEGWLHEMGHYLNLIHTHEGDLVADTIFDPNLPDPYDCGVHDRNLVQGAEAAGESADDIQSVLHNVMSYHCDPTVLTPLQVIRMWRALLDYRSRIIIPEPDDAPPQAAIALPPEAPGGRVVIVDGAASVELGGGGSTDGDGGKEITYRWTLVENPGTGARFDTPAQGWARARSSFGYGDDDDLSELADMRDRYLTVYVTRAFQVADPARLAALVLEVTYDDGIAVYLNGSEVARRNLVAGAAPGTRATTSVDSVRELIDLSGSLGLLRAGSNRLSIEVHNSALDSSDLSLHPILRARTTTGSAQTLIPSRAVWHLRKGSEGAPPADWKQADFDPSAGRVRVALTRAGSYRIRLTVDDGRPPANTATAEVVLVVEESGFVRGDCNGDRGVDLADPLKALLYLFADQTLGCEDACDANDDERLDLTDAVVLLEHLFRGGAPPAAPYPAAGADADGLTLGCGA